MTDPDHYKVLGVAATATPDQLRDAWRRQARALHPDLCGGDATAFTRARAAFDLLADPDERERYDRRRARALVGVDLLGAIDLPFALALAGGEVTVALNFDGQGMRRPTLKIPPNAAAGMRFSFAGRGGAGSPPGRLIVEIRAVLPDPRWTVVDLDLHTHQRVPLADIYEGAEIVVEAPTGPLAVRLPRGELKQLRVVGHGLTHGRQVGDLVISLEVVFPPLDARLRAELRRLA